MGDHSNIEHEAEAEDDNDDSKDVQHTVHRLKVRDDMVKILCKDAVQLVGPYPHVFRLEAVRIRVSFSVIGNGF